MKALAKLQESTVAKTRTDFCIYVCGFIAIIIANIEKEQSFYTHSSQCQYFCCKL